MADNHLSDANRILMETMAFVRDEPKRVLMLLDHAISQSLETDPRATLFLARHAGTIAENLGDHRRALNYLLVAAAQDEADALLRLAIGKLHRTLGEEEPARAAFRLSETLARRAGDLPLAVLATRLGGHSTDGDS